jgi:DNA-binding NarL/FixJ family response regulator
MLSASLQHPPKSAGRAIVVGLASARLSAQKVLQQAGYDVECLESPYAAMLELCRRPLVYRTLVLSLQGLYRDELNIISVVRRRFSHISIWISHTDGRQTALAEAMRLGAEAIVTDDAVLALKDHAATSVMSGPMMSPPMISPSMVPTSGRPMQFRPVPAQTEYGSDKPLSLSPGTVAMLDSSANEPVLSADELKALLDDDLT